MIERRFVKEKINDYKIQQYLESIFNRSNYSHTIIQKTPLGEKIVIFSSKPGLVVGRGGSNLKAVVQVLKKDFGMQSPQVEVQEISEPDLDASIVAEKISEMLTRMGTNRFKFVGHNMVQKIVDAGAIGAEIRISGKVPSKRAKTWKFTLGFLPKTGFPADEYVRKGFRIANLKTGIIGITVKLLPPNTEMPDQIIVMDSVKVEQAPVSDAEMKIAETAEVKPAEKKASLKIVEKIVKAEHSMPAEEEKSDN